MNPIPELDPDDLWDRWKTAQAHDPELTLETFAASLGLGAEQHLAALRILESIERSAPPSPLIDALLEPEGMSFAGHRILRRLGQGSSGIVFLAVDEKDGPDARPVALKVLNPLLSATSEARRIILVEAQIAKRLDHPGLVRVLSSGIERGYAWIATEWVEGRALDASIPATGDRFELAVDVALQLARALEHAHARGIVHRDLKPANVIVTPAGIVKILDFGLARAEGTTFAISRSGEAVGTPLYMAPEQWRGDEKIGAWTDVFAVGLLVWQVATERQLGMHDDLAQTLRRIASSKRRLSGADLALLQSGLRAIVGRCIEPHPENRYQDCTALARDLEALREKRALVTGSLPFGTRCVHTWHRHPWRWSGALAGCALLAWAGQFGWLRRPMPVHFREEHGGKQLWIDGAEIGTTPITFSLWPGRHAWVARSENPAAQFSGELVVEKGQELYLWEVLDLPYGRTPTEGLPGDVPGERCAWITVDTNLEAVQLTLDGKRVDLHPGLAAFRWKLGPHEFIVEAQGRRSVLRRVDIADQSLHAYAFELDRVDDPWTTTLVYSPLDPNVREGVLRSEGARFYFENSVVSASNTNVANRAYFGPERTREPAIVVFAVDLGVEVKDIEVTLLTNMLASMKGSWSRLDVGPDEAHLVHLVQLGANADVERDWTHKDEVSQAAFLVVPSERAKALAAAMNGKSRLIVRWSSGGVLAGGDDSTGAQMLRTQVLPEIVDGKLLWAPALRIRAR